MLVGMGVVALVGAVEVAPQVVPLNTCQPDVLFSEVEAEFL